MREIKRLIRREDIRKMLEGLREKENGGLGNGKIKGGVSDEQYRNKGSDQ